MNDGKNCWAVLPARPAPLLTGVVAWATTLRLADASAIEVEHVLKYNVKHAIAKGERRKPNLRPI